MAEKPKRKSSIMTLIKAVAFVSVLVVVQVVGASFLFPSATETEQLARDLAAAEDGQEPNETESGTTITDAQTRRDEEAVEVALGSISVTRVNHEADTTLQIDCELFATVLLAEQAEFNTQYEINRNRVSEQIHVTLRSADVSYLTDPGLGLIKRQILEKVNRALGKPLVREILVTRFNFVER